MQEAPYVMLKKNAELFQDNDRYEGMFIYSIVCLFNDSQYILFYFIYLCVY